MTPAANRPSGPMSLMMATGMAFLAFLFVPARRNVPAAAEPAAPRIPTPDPVPFAPVPFDALPAATRASAATMPPLTGPRLAAAPPADLYTGRPEPTPLGRRVLDALEDSGPLRKCDVAAVVGIGRGSANRIVDRLAQGGWLRRSGPDTYVLA